MRCKRPQSTIVKCPQEKQPIWYLKTRIRNFISYLWNSPLMSYNYLSGFILPTVRLRSAVQQVFFPKRKSPLQCYLPDISLTKICSRNCLKREDSKQPLWAGHWTKPYFLTLMIPDCFLSTYHHFKVSTVSTNKFFFLMAGHFHTVFKNSKIFL